MYIYIYTKQNNQCIYTCLVGYETHPICFKLSTNCGWKGSQCNPVDWRWFSNSTFFWAPHQNRHVEIETLLHPESRKLNEVEFPLFPYFGVETARSVFSPRISGDFVSHMLHPNGLDQNANLCYCTWSWSFFFQWARGGLLIFDHFLDAPVFTSTVLADAACAALFFPHAADGFFWGTPIYHSNVVRLSWWHDDLIESRWVYNDMVTYPIDSSDLVYHGDKVTP
jgi:hypothetical protein